MSNMIPSVTLPFVANATTISSAFYTTNSSTGFTAHVSSNVAIANYFANQIVAGGGNIPLGIESLMAQVDMMRKPDLDDFLFRVIKKHYACPTDDAKATADTALHYTQEALRRSGYVLPTGIYHLPDGAVLTVEYNQNYQICDKSAKVTYRANRHREFNEYVNVSDVLDQFMKYAAGMGLTREQFLAIPLQTFLMWLIIEAAKKDGEIVPDDDVKQLELALGT